VHDNLVGSRDRLPLVGPSDEPRGLANAESSVGQFVECRANGGGRRRRRDGVEKAHLTEVDPEYRRLAGIPRHEKKGPIAADRDSEITRVERCHGPPRHCRRIGHSSETRCGLLVDPHCLAAVTSHLVHVERGRDRLVVPLSRHDPDVHA